MWSCAKNKSLHFWTIHCYISELVNTNDVAYLRFLLPTWKKMLLHSRKSARLTAFYARKAIILQYNLLTLLPQRVIISISTCCFAAQQKPAVRDFLKKLIANYKRYYPLTFHWCKQFSLELKSPIGYIMNTVTYE